MQRDDVLVLVVDALDDVDLTNGILIKIIRPTGMKRLVNVHQGLRSRVVRLLTEMAIRHMLYLACVRYQQ